MTDKTVQGKSIWCFYYDMQIFLVDGKCHNEWCDFDCDADHMEVSPS